LNVSDVIKREKIPLNYLRRKIMSIDSPKHKDHPGLTTKSPRPRLYYGYIIVVVGFLLTMFGWGIFYIYGVFFRPLENEFEWTRAVTSGAFSISVLISGLSGIVAGRLCDRFGPRVVILACAVMLSAGYMLMSIVHNAWQFYLLYGILISAGVGGYWSPPVSTVARWFTGKRGLMTGIVSGGISFGTLVLPPLATQLIDAFDWRVTYVIIGAAVLIISLVGSYFLKRSPQEMGMEGEVKGRTSKVSRDFPQSFTLREALRTRQFWMVCAIYICFGLVQLTIMVHIVPHAVGMQISPINAATILSVIGGVSLAARIIIGAITDKIKVKTSVIICLGLLALALVWLQFSDNLWKLYLFALIFGVGYGGLSCLQSLIAAELYGLMALGVITAMFSFSFDLGGAIGPFLAGYIFDLSSSYFWAFLICLLVALTGLIISASLKPPRKS
jgi:MFS family permease